MIPRSPEQSIPEPQGFSFLEYDKAREKIPENTRASVDAWREEVLVICQAHGVDHPSKLVLAETHATTDTLERVQNLLDDILYVFEHQKLPPEKKEVEPVDDQEYVVPLDGKEDPSGDIKVQDLHGQFYFLDDRSSVPCLMTHTGEKRLLPEKVDPLDFVFLGSQPVLIVSPKGVTGNRFFLMDLHGNTLYPDLSFENYGTEKNHLVKISKEGMSEKCHPVGKDGTIYEDITFGINDEEGESKLVQTDLIGSRPYFITLKNGWKIFAADGTPVGDPDGYWNKPFLCEDQGRLTIVTKDEKSHTWWICDDQGEFMRDIKVPDAVHINNVNVIGGTYLLGGRQAGGKAILFNEHGTVLWKRRSEEKITEIIPSGATFLFSTEENFTNPDPEDSRSIICFYTSQGEEIAHYDYYCLAPPFCMGEKQVYFSENASIGEKDSVHLRFPGGRNAVIATFKKVYAMQAIDQDRFYVIGLEENANGTYQVVKRVYDIQQVKPSEEKEIRW